MADNIGVLGSDTSVTIGSHTVYTCPSGKAAKIKIMYRGVAAANSTLKLTVNGIDIFLTAALSVGNVSHSTSLLMHNSQAAASVDGSSDAKTVAPGPKEYYLSAGDTVTSAIGTADFTSLNVQVVGVEVDAS